MDILHVCTFTQTPRRKFNSSSAGCIYRFTERAKTKVRMACSLEGPNRCTTKYRIRWCAEDRIANSSDTLADQYNDLLSQYQEIQSQNEDLQNQLKATKREYEHILRTKNDKLEQTEQTLTSTLSDLRQSKKQNEQKVKDLSEENNTLTSSLVAAQKRIVSAVPLLK